MEIKQEPSPAVTGMSAGQGISSKTMAMIKTMETAPQPSLQNKSQGKKSNSHFNGNHWVKVGSKV